MSRWTPRRVIVRTPATCAGCGDELHPPVRGVGGDEALYDPGQDAYYGDQCGCAERREQPCEYCDGSGRSYSEGPEIAGYNSAGAPYPVEHWYRCPECDGTGIHYIEIEMVSDD